MQISYFTLTLKTIKWVVYTKKLAPIFYLISIYFFVTSCTTLPVDNGETSHTSSDAITDESHLQPKILLDIDKKKYQTSLLHIRKKKYNEANNILSSLQNNYPSHFGIHYNAALCLMELGQINEAYTRAAHAKKINGKSAELNNLLGLIAIHNKQLKKAEEYYLKSLMLDNNYSYAHYNLALLYDIYFQDISSALKHYQYYIIQHPNDTKTKEWLEQLKYTRKHQQ